MKRVRAGVVTRATAFGVGLLFLLAVTLGQAQNAPSAPPAANAAPVPVAAKPAIAPAVVDVPVDERLVRVKRIFVDSFGDEPIPKQVQAMIIASLTESKKFIVTENKEKADAILRGTGLEKTSQEIHAYNDSTAAGGASGGHSSTVGGSWVNGTGSISGSSSGGFISRAAAISDSSTNTETIHDARVAVRLVDRDGDVIWATTQESKGAKYKGASADVAEKVVKQLLHDVERLEHKVLED